MRLGAILFEQRVKALLYEFRVHIILGSVQLNIEHDLEQPSRRQLFLYVRTSKKSLSPFH